jgi:NAD(P)-dependent dehydrogenase (short-subunit alcohol dehydrogenase family)
MNTGSKSRRALIVGGGSGLGLAAAQALAAAGWRVFLTGRRAETLTQACATMPKGAADSWPGDATQEADVAKIVAAAKKFLGRIDALVVSSGTSSIGSVLDAKLDDVVSLLHTNLLPTFLFSKAVAPAMTEGGAIIAIASVAGSVPHPDRLAYCTSKAGLIGMVKQMALDLAPRRIRVNAVSPSLVLTDLSRRSIAGAPNPEEMLARRTAQHPIGRLGTPADIGAAVAYLCGEHAGWITGQDLVLDGGLTISTTQLAATRAPALIAP